MRKITKRIRLENQFRLTERSVAAIKSYNTQDYFEPHNDDEIMEQFTLLYEIEYKYSMLSARAFDGNISRKENIMKILEEKAKEVIPPLADTFVVVFEDWLSRHALTDPEEWAKMRLDEIEGYGYESYIDILMSELQRYDNSYRDFGDVLKNIVELRPELFEDFFDIWVKDYYDRYINDLKDMGVEEFNDIYEFLFNIEFGTEEEAEEYIDTHFAGFDKDFFQVHGGKEDATRYIIEEMEEMEMFTGGMETISNYIDMDDVLLYAYKDILFPKWYGYWKSMGIDKTRDNVEKVTKQLKNIEHQPLNKQFMILNIAKNTNHQSGSMMEYYEETWEIDYDFFKRLSNSNTKEWDKELVSIGVQI